MKKLFGVIVGIFLITGVVYAQGLGGGGSVAQSITQLFGSLDAADNPITNVDYIDLDTAGVRLDSDDDGALVITGQGNGSDESLSINLDDTANTAVIGTSTGITSIDFSDLSLINIAEVVADILTVNATFVSSGDAKISNASPSIEGVDTDTTNDVVTGRIKLGHCTSVTTDAEYCDIGFWQMIDGALTQVGLIDADGKWQFLKELYFANNTTLASGTYLTTDTADGSTFTVAPWDVDGASFSSYGLTFTSGNSPTVSGEVKSLIIDAGSGTERLRPSGTICSSTSAVGNVGTGEDDLITCTMPANTMPNNGDLVVMRAHGTVANNANAKRIRARIGTALMFDSGALPTSAAFDWALTCEIYRAGATAERSSCTWSSSNATVPILMDVTTPGADLTTSLSLKITGEAVSNSDIVQNAGSTTFLPTS